MNERRTVEVFGAGCPACEETIALVNKLACPACHIEVLDIRRPEAAAKAKRYGVRIVPAVAVNGKLAACCTGSGPQEAALRAAGLGAA